MTYRTGNHWGVTIVREPDQPTDGTINLARAQLVAVVVNGDTELAERICALLNAAERPGLLTQAAMDMTEADVEALRVRFLESAGMPLTVLPHTPDVDYLRGAAEALANVADRIADTGGSLNLRALREILEGVAAELGLEEDAPPARSVAPGSAEQPSGVAESTPDPSKATQGECARQTCRTTDPVTDDRAYCHGTGRRCPRHGEVI